MTVGELILQLLEHPYDTKIVVNGYEEGYEDDNLITTKVYLKQNKHGNKSGIYGRCDTPEHCQDPRVKNEGADLEAVLICRNRPDWAWTGGC